MGSGERGYALTGVKTVDVVRRMWWGGGGEVLSSRAGSKVRQVSLASSLPLGTAGGRTRSADRRPCLADCRGPSEPNRHSSKGEPHVSVPRSAPLHPLPVKSLTSNRVSDGGAEIIQGQKKRGDTARTHLGAQLRLRHDMCRRRTPAESRRSRDFHQKSAVPACASTCSASHIAVRRGG